MLQATFKYVPPSSASFTNKINRKACGLLTTKTFKFMTVTFNTFALKALN